MPKIDSKLRARLAAIILNPLPATMRRGLFEDEAFLDSLGLSPKLWLKIDDDRSAEATSLHNSLRLAIDGKKSSNLELSDGSRPRIRLQRHEGGSVTLHLQKKRYSFLNADPLSSDKAKRLTAIDRLFAAYPLLSVEEEHFRSIANQRELADREYVDLMTRLQETPEAFSENLKKPQELSAENLFCNQILYFERLVAPWGASTNVDDFLGKLSSARAELLARRPRTALRRMAFGALWQQLIPFELLASVKLKDLQLLLDAADPFSLLFGFELCCTHRRYGDGFVKLGGKFLQKLLLDRKLSMHRCEIFSAVAMMSTVMIRHLPTVDGRPLFWVRLIALTHASVLTDALRHLPDSEGFFKWSMKHIYQKYTWYGLADRFSSPRWKPDWISPPHIYAELLGRVFGAIQTVPVEERPPEWMKLAQRALAGLVKKGTALETVFPGPFDDYRKSSPDPSSRLPPFRKGERRAERAMRLDKIPNLVAIAYSTQPSERILATVLRILNLPQDRPIASADTQPAYLQLCAHIAVSTRSEDIARSLINRILPMLARTSDVRNAVHLFGVMLKACAAFKEAADFRRMIGVTAANSCYAVNDLQCLAAFAPPMELLTQRDKRLIPILARARAIVRTRTMASS